MTAKRLGLAGKELAFHDGSGVGRRGTAGVKPHTHRHQPCQSRPGPTPQLNIQRANNDNVALFWTTDAADFRLESVTNLSAVNNWLEVTNARTTVGDQIYVTNSAAGTSKFFRLSFPAAAVPHN